MRFTDGFWLLRPGVTAHYGREAYDLERADGGLVVTAPTKVITTRGDTLNLPVLTVTVAPHLPGIIRVRIVHHAGGGEPLRFDVTPADGSGEVRLDGEAAVVRSVPDLIEAAVRLGRPEDAVDRDHLLTNVMLYWLTNTATSSARLYFEAGTCRPTVVAVFPKDIALPVRSLAEKTHNIVHWSEFGRGGHFAALEQPETFVEELRTFFRLVR